MEDVAVFARDPVISVPLKICDDYRIAGCGSTNVPGDGAGSGFIPKYSGFNPLVAAA
ncbi:hypothetical protein D3C78_1799340 [compost metagenome]